MTYQVNLTSVFIYLGADIETEELTLMFTQEK